MLKMYIPRQLIVEFKLFNLKMQDLQKCIIILEIIFRQKSLSTNQIQYLTQKMYEFFKI
jgi:hypothetical protein